MKRTLITGATSLLFICLLAIAPGWAQPNVKELSKEQLDEFRELTKRKVNDFTEKLSIIADRKRPLEERIMAKELAMDYFIKWYSKGNQHRTPMVQVSNKNGRIRSSPIEQYLNDLLITNRFLDINITFYDAAVVSEFEKGVDGDYYATASYFQDFKGYGKDGKLLYSDRTNKKIAITGKSMETSKDLGKLDLKVFFGDITVTETTPIPVN
ncbi:hypothetical protein GCM10023187_53000 [Nibrella viscosa]|uniref:Uncharacterized protein n=1 Tax=Nibrella viscosa TaxID=1084524 RepID=A0ABP8KYT4_9BACT